MGAEIFRKMMLALSNCQLLKGLYLNEAGISRYPLDYQNWVVAFVRDIKSQKNDAHSFILVEGMNAFGHLLFYCYDLATRVNEQVVHGNRMRILTNPTMACFSLISLRYIKATFTYVALM